MKHIICSSFGKDSNATALLALQHGEPLDEIIYTEVMFSKEISGELPEHARFIYETAIPYFEKRGIPTRVLHAEKTYLDCFYHVVSRGNAQGKLAAFPLAGRCAIQRDCKVPPLEAYKRGLPPGTVSYLGIAADEPIRLERLKPDQVSLMAKYGVTEQDAFAMCRQEGLLSPLYEYSHRGGCWFCPNASMTELRHLYHAHPDLWQLMLELQETPNKATERFNRNFTFAELDLRFRLEGEQACWTGHLWDIADGCQYAASAAVRAAINSITEPAVAGSRFGGAERQNTALCQATAQGIFGGLCHYQG